MRYSQQIILSDGTAYHRLKSFVIKITKIFLIQKQYESLLHGSQGCCSLEASIFGSPSIFYKVFLQQYFNHRVPECKYGSMGGKLCSWQLVPWKSMSRIFGH